MGKLTSSRIEPNEVVKANDITYGLDSQIQNIVTMMHGIIECNQDFVINGTVEEYSGGGMNVKINPIFGICKSTEMAALNTDGVDQVGIGDGWEVDRIDIIEVAGNIANTTKEQRSFIDFNTKEKSLQDIFTKQELSISVNVKHNSNTGSFVDQAPETTEGYIKLAEIFVPANAVDISECTINNITADIEGMENEEWTNEKDQTYNPGYISKLNERFRQEHNEDGTHQDAVIHSSNIDKGTGNNQLNGSVVPVGGSNFSFGSKSYTGSNTIAEGFKGVADAFEELTTIKTDDETNLFYKIMLLAHPVGSLYWSSKSDNPSTLFGGTWEQIKDKFIWAKGDEDTVNATGGSKTVTLTKAQMPSHNHSFSYSGTTNTVDTNHTHNMQHWHNRGSMNITASFPGDDYAISKFEGAFYSEKVTYYNTQHFETVGSGVSYADKFDASRSWTGLTSDALWSDGATGRPNTGACNGENASVSHSHTYSGSGNTEGEGSGNAHENMPPYIVKYCWERTA